ncbi:Nodulin-like / Major Facilitator Superfamily protein [Zostera marina]|uniref:Nodulin-like / Major Facilitator Superfamily protein n=1 Tax=Zostera marina TaxID=29655 RepID=A0A0K9PD12_ZOSMR|nr:Nodulin-like / Major Facilitator Superfamily protein [Zostera marina]
MVAVGPTMVVIAFMFFVRPVGGHLQIRSSDDSAFTFIYSLCLLLAAYLMGVMLLQDLVELNYVVVVVFTLILFVLLLLPIAIPLISSCFLDPTATPTGEESEREQLLPKVEVGRHGDGQSDDKALSIVLSDIEDERLRGNDSLPLTTEQDMQRHKRIAQLQARLIQTYSSGAVKVHRRRKRGPRRGEDFTLRQALIKADFWLLFFSLMLGSGSGLTVIDNLGQMSESAGYDQPHIFVSLISIFNFLGRVGGGYFSELIITKKAFPRPAALSVAQFLMAIGHFMFAMAWPGTMYVSTLLVGLGYGAHWAIVPASASELFGLRNFGALYNFLTIANPAGSLLFSGIVASYIYDSEAEKQAGGFRPSSVLGLFLTSDEPLVCMGRSCFFLTSLMLSGLCIVAAILTIILVFRTRTVYTHLYGNSSV